MAQYDLHLNQNEAPSGIEFSEKIVTPVANSLLGFDGSLAPANVQMSATGGLVISSNQMGISLSGLAAWTTPADNDLLLIYDSANTVLKKITKANLIDNKVKVDSAASADYIGALASDGVLRVSSDMTYADGGNFVTLGVVTATTTVKGIASFNSTDFSVASGAVSLSSNIIKWVTAPGSKTAAGTAGQIAYDDDYYYVCVLTGIAGSAKWKRTPLANW